MPGAFTDDAFLAVMRIEKGEYRLTWRNQSWRHRFHAAYLRSFSGKP